jgi:hypothetical protein
MIKTVKMSELTFFQLFRSHFCSRSWRRRAAWASLNQHTGGDRIALCWEVGGNKFANQISTELEVERKESRHIKVELKFRSLRTRITSNQFQNLFGRWKKRVWEPDLLQRLPLPTYQDRFVINVTSHEGCPIQVNNVYQFIQTSLE